MGSGPSSLIKVKAGQISGDSGQAILLNKLQAHPQLLSSAYSTFFSHTGETALHAACEGKQVQAVQAIVSFLSTAPLPTVQAALQPYCRRTKRPLPSSPAEGVRIAVDMTNCKGQTPLMFACAAGSPELVKLLLAQGADPWLGDHCGCRVALHYAAMAGHAACVQALMGHIRLQDMARGGVRYVDARSVSGLTALHYVAYFDHLAVLEELLPHDPFLNAASRACSYDVFVMCDVGCTPLHFAAMRGHAAIARRLLEHQCWSNTRAADPRTRRNADGMVPWQVAASHHPSQRDLVALLHPGQTLERALGLGLGLAADGSPVAATSRRGALPLAALAAAALQAKLLADLRQLAPPSQECAGKEGKEKGAANLSAPTADGASCKAATTVASQTAAVSRGQSRAPGRTHGVTPGIKGPSAAATAAPGVAYASAAAAAAPQARTAVVGTQVGVARTDDDDDEEGMCGVCFARRVEVAPAGCGHGLCSTCAAEMCRGMLTAMGRPRPMQCAFCRQEVAGFVQAVPAASR